MPTRTKCLTIGTIRPVTSRLLLFLISLVSPSVIQLSSCSLSTASAFPTTGQYVRRVPLDRSSTSVARAKYRTTPLWAEQSNKKPRFVKSKRSSSHGSKRRRPFDTRALPSATGITSPRVATAAVPRPVLTQYRTHRNDRINEQRLKQDRVGCEHFGSCSGCSTNDHVGEVDIIRSARLYFSSTAIRRKRADVIRREGRDSPLITVVEEAEDQFYQVVVPSPLTGWRTQAKLAVAPKSSVWNKDGCTLGLYKRGTHQILSIPNCAVHHPSINVAAEALTQATAKVGIAAFAEDKREGDLRYVQFQVERTTGKVCLTLIWHASDIKETQPALSRLVKELMQSHPTLWHSIWCHCNDGLGNNIFSRNAKRWNRISGPEFIREPLPIGEYGWLYFNPLTFRQGNLDGFDILAIDVARAVPGGSRVCELYAGVGVLGLTALAYHATQSQKPLVWIRCSDENPANPRCFEKAVDSLPPAITGRGDDQRKNSEDRGMTLAELAKLMESGESFPDTERKGDKASYMVATATQALKAGQALGASVLIVDPPRKGLDDGVLDELCKPYNPEQPFVESVTVLTMPDDKVNWANNIERLIYVSCGFDALARDCERLLSSSGGWLLESATGYVLFPGSDHVETICVFQRR